MWGRGGGGWRLHAGKMAHDSDVYTVTANDAHGTSP